MVAYVIAYFHNFFFNGHLMSRYRHYAVTKLLNCGLANLWITIIVESFVQKWYCLTTGKFFILISFHLLNKKLTFCYQNLADQFSRCEIRNSLNTDCYIILFTTQRNDFLVNPENSLNIITTSKLYNFDNSTVVSNYESNSRQLHRCDTITSYMKCQWIRVM